MRHGVSLVEVMLALAVVALFLLPLLTVAHDSRLEVADASQILLALDAPDSFGANRPARNPSRDPRAGGRLLVRDLDFMDPLAGVAPLAPPLPKP